MTHRAFSVYSDRAKYMLALFLTFLLFSLSFAVLAQPLPTSAKQNNSLLSAPPKPISQLKVGDIIRARDRATGRVSWKQVTHASKRTVASLLKIQMADIHNGRPAETLFCPLDQSVRLADGRAVPAGHLSVGNSIVPRAGPVCKVKAMFLLRKPGGFVLCDVRVGPVSPTRLKLLLSEEAERFQPKPHLDASFATYKTPAPNMSYMAPAVSGSGTPNNFLFQGQQYDSASNDYYLRARYYDPTMGRFLSSDPFAGDPYNPATFHRYTYAGNDPVNFIDPSGKDGELASIGAATASASIIVAEEEPAIVTSLEEAQGVAGEAADAVSGTVETALQRASDVFVRRWNPFTGPGPLGNLPNAQEVINSFRGGSYSEVSTTEATTLYRVYPTGGNVLGSYWTRIPPSGPLQSQLDAALLPEWGNTAENVATIQVPSGTTLYEGFAEAQYGTATLPGGGSQVFIPQVDPSWLVK